MTLPTDQWMVSVDDHIIESREVWQDRLSAKFRDRGPRWVTFEDGGEGWLFEEATRGGVPAMNVNGAIWPEEQRFEPFTSLRWDEVPRAAYDPRARIEAMNTHNVVAAIIFANYPGFTGNLFSVTAEDKDLALACIQAYNDWFLEEGCDAYPGRFIGQMLMPLWDPKLCGAEVERTAGRGARAVAFPGLVHNLGLPPITDYSHWDPFFSTLNSTGLVLNSHDASSSGMSRANDARKTMAELRTSMVEQVRKQITNAIEAARDEGKDINVDMAEVDEILRSGNMGKLMQIRGLREAFAGGPMAGMRDLQHEHLREWLNGGVFERYPNIKLIMSEISIGWVPGVIDSMPDPETMRAVFRGHIYSAWIPSPVDGTGAQEFADRDTLARIGIDNVLCETDFPHTATLWPNSMESAIKTFANIGLSDEERLKILRGNAERILQFTPSTTALGSS